jgi:Ca2+-binding RTX toxin-like protein
VSTDSSQGDSLYGGQGADILISSGHSFNETMAFNPDNLIGGPGTDLLVGQHGGLTDFVLLGDGDVVKVRNYQNASPPTSPRLDYRQAPGPILVDLEAGFGKVIGSAVQDTVEGLANAGSEVVLGTNGPDQLLGRNVPPPPDPNFHVQDFLNGRGGDDVVQGRAGHDWVSGQNGDDLLDGGADDDMGTGGAGTDTCTSVEEPDGCEVLN